MSTRGMTVGDLRKALYKLPDTMEVVVRGDNDEGDQVFCGGILTAEVEHGCDDTPAFVIDCTEDALLLEAVSEDVADVG
jgi:hypothetical protein